MSKAMNEADLTKLTVSQLKLLCKEKKITGYSKLPKPGIIQKLLDWQKLRIGDTVNTTTVVHSSPSSKGTSGDVLLAGKPDSSHAAPTTAVISEPGIASLPITSGVSASSETRPDSSSATAVLPPLGRRGEPQQIETQPLASFSASLTALKTSDLQLSQKIGSTKRPSATAALPPLARHGPQQIETQPFASFSSSLNQATLQTSDLQLSQKIGPTKRPSDEQIHNDQVKKARLSIPSRFPLSVPTSTFKVPSVPERVSKDAVSTMTSLELTRFPLANQPPSRILTGSKTSTALSSSKPFKALVSIKKSTNGSANSSFPEHNMPTILKSTSRTCAEGDALSLSYLDFSKEDDVILGHISLAPSISQRKRVPKLAVILSGLSQDDLKTCSQVSRLFRYSAYVSAAHQLTACFPGLRTRKTLERYSPKVTDFWPYLNQRRQEVSKRKTAYKQSFLGRALNGLCDISDGLWLSPGNEKQATIAVRFLMTRFFFLVSVGYGNDPKALMKGTVINAEEVIENELWKITFRSASSIEQIYVLEPTCEVVGQSGQTVNESPSSHLREDWSAYVAARLKIPSQEQGNESAMTLFDHLQWTNHEEYTLGISNLWRARISEEGDLGLAKMSVARRYILACVVSNSVSGQWLTSNQMAQDFNGLQASLVATREQRSGRLNLFLPMHHHVESLHFTSGNGQALHPALAIVQTPGREYYILKDNGMQVGCEEEGVALVWMKLLRCCQNGCPDLRHDGQDNVTKMNG
ncbi:hypothetical protein B0H34DRAFT_859112 [Crassisporium funariophilum]|nr:hypothetical protein B0H34DRAFT_859112 [Crassisporium funariophilum]